jgi:hypothetical protein
VEGLGKIDGVLQQSEFFVGACLDVCHGGGN